MVNKLCICWSEKLCYYQDARCYNKKSLNYACFDSCKLEERTHKIYKNELHLNNKIKVFSEMQSSSDIQGVTKILGHVARMSIARQNKQIFRINMCPEMSDFLV
jgi:hypothetical protein